MIIIEATLLPLVLTTVHLPRTTTVNIGMTTIDILLLLPLLLLPPPDALRLPLIIITRRRSINPQYKLLLGIDTIVIVIIEIETHGGNGTGTEKGTETSGILGEIEET